MEKITTVATFKDKKIRRQWDPKSGKWYFSVVDVIKILTESTTPKRYWSDLKIKLNKEGSQLYEFIVQLKMISPDGKKYNTDAADVESLLRIIQSIPSPKAEPFKLWLAKVGNERIQEIVDPERSINRARNNWKRFGHSEKWIIQRMMGLETRNKLTDYWSDHEINKQNEYAILTNLIHHEWSELTVKEHKHLKNLTSENLRDHMTGAELIFTSLAELSTREIASSIEAKGLSENIPPAIAGGGIAKNARAELEAKSGKKIISPTNMLKPKKLPWRG